jgi:endonuclease-8
VAVCFSAPVVELERSPQVGHLGPDLCGPDVDLDECVRRIDLADPATELADVLLDQRIACGVGNVYKSEACWACFLDPTAPLAAIGAADRRRLWATAARQLQANLGGPERRTHPAGLAVYGRRDRPCFRCSTPIAAARHGDLARLTYWCPGCQTRTSAEIS